MFYLKKILSALAVPPFGLILLAAAGLVLARRHRRAGTVLATVALVLLAAASLPLVGNALLRSVESDAPISQKDLAGADAIVVLGGGSYYAAPEYGGDTVNQHSLERVRYAALLQRRSGLPVLVTGGAPFGGRPEADLMSAVLEGEFGVKVRWRESASRDTAENAAFSAPLLRGAGVRRIALVSHAWHLPRAIPSFERLGFVVVPAPTGFTTDSPDLLADLLPSARALAQSQYACHEWLGRWVRAWAERS